MVVAAAAAAAAAVVATEADQIQYYMMIAYCHPHRRCQQNLQTPSMMMTMIPQVVVAMMMKSMHCQIHQNQHYQ